MKFYVIPEYRRKGYGKVMFNRLESLFSGHNIKRICLTSDPITGDPFWKSLGFQETGEISSENKQKLYEKDVCCAVILELLNVNNWLKICDLSVSEEQKEIFPIPNVYWIGISRYEEHTELFAIKQYETYVRLIGGGLDEDGVSGYINPLMIDVKYQQQDISTLAIKLMIEYLIRTYHISAINIGHRKVNNIAGAIYEKLGFKIRSETKTEFRRTLIIEPKITTISMTIHDIPFLHKLMIEPKIRDTIHIDETTIEYWQTAFQNWERDNDEENYIIKLGTIPVGWISFNGLKSNDIGWIKMVVISSNYHHRGIGTYAVKYALDYFKSKGFNKVGIYTTEDNKSAHRCYIKCGFIVTEYGDCTTSDGKNRKGYTFEKKI